MCTNCWESSDNDHSLAFLIGSRSWRSSRELGKIFEPCAGPGERAFKHVERASLISYEKVQCKINRKNVAIFPYLICWRILFQMKTKRLKPRKSINSQPARVQVSTIDVFPTFSVYCLLTAGFKQWSRDMTTANGYQHSNGFLFRLTCSKLFIKIFHRLLQSFFFWFSFPLSSFSYHNPLQICWNATVLFYISTLLYYFGWFHKMFRLISLQFWNVCYFC